jgi:hypothetical protein
MIQGIQLVRGQTLSTYGRWAFEEFNDVFVAQDCPKCGRPMTLRRAHRAPHPADDEHVFHCPHCHVDYVVKGNMPTGREAGK